MTELVSVVFPVGPGDVDAAAALRDMLGQTWQELEVLLVLNGASAKVRADLEKVQDMRVRRFDLGAEPALLPALQLAIKQAKGRFLARMDADDRCDPRRIEATIQPLSAGQGEVASCGIELCDPLGAGMERYVDWVNGLDSAEKVSRNRFVESPVVQPTVIVSRAAFERAGGYRDDGLPEDYSLWLRLLGDGVCFSKVPSKLYQWRDRPDRLTRSDERFSQQKMLAAKAEGLARLDNVRDNGVMLAGGGPIGRRLARRLDERGIEVRGFFEVNPAKIGRTILGKPVFGLEKLGTVEQEAVLLATVGGKRELLRELAKEAGYREGDDFWACC